MLNFTSNRWTDDSLHYDLLSDFTSNSYAIKEMTQCTKSITIEVRDPIRRAVPMTHEGANPMLVLLDSFRMLSASGDLLNLTVKGRIEGSSGGLISPMHLWDNYVSVRLGDQLDMMVCTDHANLIDVLSGASVLRFMILQEYMAKKCGMTVGKFTFVIHKCTCPGDVLVDLHKQDYQQPGLPTMPMIAGDPDAWWRDVTMFGSEGPVMGIKDRFVRKVLAPIYEADRLVAQGEYHDLQEAYGVLDRCQAEDWREACKNWIAARTHETA